jgi:hypothetical protein
MLCDFINMHVDNTIVIDESSPSVLGAPTRRVVYATEDDVRKGWRGR